MNIVICGSLKFSHQMKEIADSLIDKGFEVEIPWGAKKILDGTFDYDKFMLEKERKGDAEFRKQSREDLIIRYFDLIKHSDAILVANYKKGEIENYIGGNSFLEMGFAYVLGKKIYLLNPIPKMSYTDELIAMKPIVINGELSKIK